MADPRTTASSSNGVVNSNSSSPLRRRPGRQRQELFAAGNFNTRWHAIAMTAKVGRSNHPAGLIWLAATNINVTNALKATMDHSGFEGALIDWTTRERSGSISNPAGEWRADARRISARFGSSSKPIRVTA